MEGIANMFCNEVQNMALYVRDVPKLMIISFGKFAVLVKMSWSSRQGWTVAYIQSNSA